MGGIFLRIIFDGPASYADVTASNMLAHVSDVEEKNERAALRLAELFDGGVSARRMNKVVSEMSPQHLLLEGVSSDSQNGFVRALTEKLGDDDYVVRVISGQSPLPDIRFSGSYIPDEHVHICLSPTDS